MIFYVVPKKSYALCINRHAYSICHFNLIAQSIYLQMDPRSYILLSFRRLIPWLDGHSLMPVIFPRRPTQNCSFDIAFSLVIFGFMCLDDSIWLLPKAPSTYYVITFEIFVYSRHSLPTSQRPLK